jgi:transposase
MFVKTTRVKRGNKAYEYLALVEAVREEGRPRHRTLFRLGEVSALRASGELGRIVAALQAHAEGGRFEPVELDALEAQGAPAVGTIAAVSSLWRELGLDTWFAKVGADRGAEVLEHAAFAMVANRLAMARPASKRGLPEWVERDVVMPEGFKAPSLDQYYRALDAVAESKEATEQFLYSALTDLTNLDLRLCCYDLTSSYMEGSVARSAIFPSKAFGYSRDRRPDRPQIVLGLLTTGDGIPIAHHVFAGNTNDASTLPGVLDDLAERFSIRGITVVGDRGLISEANLEVVASRGFSHIMATRLHRDPLATAAIAAAHRRDATWVPVSAATAAACEVTVEGKRCVVVASAERWRRDAKRTGELVAKTEAKLLALEDRVRVGELSDPGKIGRAAQRILSASPVARVFDLEIEEGRFLYHYDEAALDYEEALAGHYILTTDLTPKEASTAWVVTAWRQLQETERRFRVLKDFIFLRPIRHWTERRVHGHVAVCVYAAVLEALVSKRLAEAGVFDPDIPEQHLTAARAMRELDRIRAVTLTAGSRTIELVTRRSALQSQILDALGVDTTPWKRARLGSR